MIRLSMSKRRSAIVPLLCATCVLAVLMSVSCAGGGPDADTSAEAKALAKLDDDWSVAAATRDAKRVASFYADDAIAYPPNEPTAVGKAEAEKVWAAYFADPTYNISWKTAHAEVSAPWATRLAHTKTRSRALTARRSAGRESTCVSGRSKATARGKRSMTCGTRIRSSRGPGSHGIGADNRCTCGPFTPPLKLSVQCPTREILHG